MTREVVDQRDRNKIKEVLDQNFLVEAGAGSGKTTSLVDRMVNLIYTDTCNIENIVAITFTRKAADELKTRFQNELENVWKLETNEKIKDRLELAIQSMERCFLGTVHAFCARLLRERPIEAKLDITFKELEQEDDYLITEEAWYTHLSMLQDKNSAVLEKFRDSGIEEDTLRERLKKQLREYPDVDWVVTPAEKPDLTTSYDAFLSLLTEASRCIPKNMDKGPDDLQKAIIESIRKNQYRNRNNKLMIEIFELFDKKSAYKITQKRWTSREDSKDYQAKIQNFFEDRIEPLLQEWKEYCHPIIIELIQGALRVYEQIKKQRSLMNFQDLLIKTSTLLKHNPEVRLYFQDKYRCILVDEFQDTDPIQAEMMFYLTGEDVTEENWSRCKPRAGSLFVVGDPKQSIYRFRRADIDIYNKVKELITEHGGNVLQLTMNFRTLDSITSKLNDIFVEQLPETETTYQAAFRPLNSFHKDNEEKLSGIRKLMVPADFTRNQQLVLDKDAENIVLSIQSLLQRGHEPKEFMIITRYTAGINVYARTLEAAGIPVHVSGDIEMGATQEFNELVLLLNVFLDPTDSLATVAALRSIYFGISDEELFQWKTEGGSFSIFSRTPEEGKETPIHPVQKSLAKLRMYAKWVAMNSPVVAIEMILEDIGFYPLLLEKGYGKREYTQILQLIEALRKQEDQGMTLYKDAMSFLEKTVEEESKTKAVNLDEDINAVRILNIHKAKGLEAPIVYLANPGKKTDFSNKINSHIKREEKGSKGYFKFAKKDGNPPKSVAQPKEWESYRAEEAAYLLQEEVRILYVAATRAEKAIIISSCAGKDTKNPWRMLLDGLEDIEEASMETEVIEKEPITETITQTNYHHETDHLTDWIAASAMPSYAKMSPSDDKAEIYTLGIEREKGGGKSWGLAIHEILEWRIKKQFSSKRLKSSLQKHELPIEREAEVKEILERFEETDLWSELERAEKVLTEVPFSLPVTEGDALFDLVKHHDGSTAFITGVIDLVYKLEGKWKVVDYKTDRPKDIDVIPDLTNYYRDQIKMYTFVWEQVTREKVESAQIYFVTPNIIVTV